MYTNDTERLFAEGGMNDEGGTVDPVSGNDVPAGSLQNEVRDDIDAKLSEGEFVVPADVVRYIGLERLMKLRDEAKAGLARMNEIGQMGNAEEVENPEALHSGEDEGFDSEIDDIMQEVEGEAMGEKKFSAGGFATPGADLLSKYNIPRTSLTNPALDVRAYKNKDGRVMYITFFNDRPSIAIPQGYSYVSSAGQLLEETKTETAKINAPSTTTIVEQGGDGGVGTGDGGATVGGSGIGTGTGIGNSPVGIAVGSIANAIESITNPNAVVSIAEDTLSVDAQGNTVSAAATAAAANAAAVAASNAADASDNGVVGSTDATAAADNSGNTSGDTGDSGDGSGDGGDGVGVGDFAKGGLVAKRTKKPTLAQKRGIASKR
jgi:hypothetical protein